MSGTRGPYRTGIETRRLLVENAIKVFGEHGFRGGSLLPDARWTFWTLTVWDSAEAMRAA